MSDVPRSLGNAIAHYLASLPQGERQTQQQELTKFARWYGLDRPLEQLTVTEVDDYVSYVESSTAEVVRPLEPLRSFLGYARRQSFFEANLAVHVRVRRSSSRKSAGRGREQPEVHMSAEGFAKMQAELADLLSQRPRLSEAIRLAAADKDFRENAPLEAAREHQGQVESRIRELETTLKAAKIVSGEPIATPAGETSRIGLGSTVVLHDLAYDEDVQYTLVGPTEADPRKGKLSVVSPTGKALMDRAAGEEVEVVAPAGTVRYRIVSVA